MFQPTLSGNLIKLAKKVPVLTIKGPSQSEKTTIAKMLFKKHAYVSLEEPHEREFAMTDPKGFLRRFSGGVILDEIQKVPIILSYIQGIVDSNGTPGRFILTGSQQFHLTEKVSQTLAGRTAIVQLLPLSLDELLGRMESDDRKIETLPSAVKKPA